MANNIYPSDFVIEPTVIELATKRVRVGWKTVTVSKNDVLAELFLKADKKYRYKIDYTIVGHDCDARHDGPRSCQGKALRKIKEMKDVRDYLEFAYGTRDLRSSHYRKIKKKAEEIQLKLMAELLSDQY